MGVRACGGACRVVRGSCASRLSGLRAWLMLSLEEVRVRFALLVDFHFL